MQVNSKSGDPNKKYNKDPLWHNIALTTYEVVGVLEPMKCMSYFPVVSIFFALKEKPRFLPHISLLL